MSIDDEIKKGKKRQNPLSGINLSKQASSNKSLDNLKDYTEVQINGEILNIFMNDLICLNTLGTGRFGTVDKMKLLNSDHMFAVKKIRPNGDQRENRQLLDLHISVRSAPCPYIVISYGAMCRDGDIWICMEVMDTSLDKLYCKIPEGDYMPEHILSYVIFCMVSALIFLHRQLKVIHRDVKPSNVLLDRSGRVKLCDFGISGYLTNSVAVSDVGSQAYLAPERICSRDGNNEYTIKSDVWSLGLSIIEVASRKFPYRKWPLSIDQLRDVVHSESVPTLPEDAPYSLALRSLISRCLVKNDNDRANYDELLDHELLKPLLNDEDEQRDRGSSLSAYVAKIMDL